MTTILVSLIGAELGERADPRVSDMAAKIAAAYPGTARGVLFYGSCLWKQGQGLDGQMLDFYLIVSSYRAAYGSGWKALANHLLPPNVFPFAHDGLAAKYAVLSEADLARMTHGTRARDVSVWARFAQPSRLVWVADETARAKVVEAISGAAPTLLRLTQPMTGNTDALDVWRAGFSLTYRSELRAERGDRSDQVVDHDPQRYRAIYDAVTRPSGDAMLSATRAARLWAGFRRRGKVLTLLRLAKATTTFAGGIDYLAWKINRHAGTAIAIKPWQRRWPLLGAITLLPKLLAGGAVR
ncbi:hypothetical protein [Sphingomonas sp. ID0503]|uniref:hypothetical protein n=1 Tax=Sphingomonas sp. ID0503 TaxID=3399691 RepID=UPI003AFAD0B9